MNVRLFAAGLALALTACTTSDWREAPGLPGDLARHDDGTIAGVWRAAPGGGDKVPSDYRVSIMRFDSFSTFAVQSGCTITGGVLRPIGGERFEIQRYETGYSDDRCGPWQFGPAIAPFDGDAVSLVREGQYLWATGPQRRVRLLRYGPR